MPDEISHELMLDISRWQIQSLLQLLDSLTDYVFFKDSRSIYFNCNRAFAKLVGLKYPHHIIGRSDYDLPWQVSSDTAGVFRRYDQQVLAGKPHTNQLQNLTLKNKSSLIISVTKIPLQDKVGNFYGLVGIARDVTAQQRMKRLLKTLQAQKKRQELKSDPHPAKGKVTKFKRAANKFRLVFIMPIDFFQDLSSPHGIAAYFCLQSELP